MLNTNSSIGHKSCLTGIIFLFVCAAVGQAQNHVRVISNDASVYTATNLLIVPQSFQVQKGDLFQAESFKDDWVAIRMFSGVSRYINITDVELINEIPSKNISDRIKMCDEIQAAQSKASTNAFSKYPADVSKQSEFENLLVDKYILNIFRKHDTPAAYHSIMLECVNDSIIPEPALEF